jgi:hypothetical protein
MVENSKIYDLLLKIKNGYDPGWRNLSGYDDLLDDVSFNPKNPSKSIVTIVFDNEDDYLKIFELDDDDMWWVRRMNSNNYDGDDYGRYELEDQWKEGYLYEALNQENKNKIGLIGLTITNDFDDLENQKKKELIYNHFEDLVFSIGREFNYIDSECKSEVLRSEIESVFGNKFYNLGIREVSPYYKYKTNVSILLRLFDTLGDSSMSIQDLLGAIIKKFNPDTDYSGGWEDVYYSVSCQNFDYERYNEDVSWYLNQIVNDLEVSDTYLDIDEYFNLIKRLKSEYSINKWTRLDKTPELYYKIDKVDPKTNKIIVTVRNNKKSYQPAETRSMDYEDLKRFESQYELFTERRKIIKKLLRSI